MSDSSEPNANADNPREDRLQEILDDCIQRRTAGEQIADEAIIADHGELMPELEQRLKALRMIQDARPMTIASQSSFGTWKVAA